MRPHPIKNTDKHLSQANYFRKSIGMKPVVPIKRSCLRCDRMFTSYGYNHRTCGCISSTQILED